MKHLLSVLAAAIFVLGFAAAGALAIAAGAGTDALKKIMADPRWIGPAVRNAYWSGRRPHAYYSLKRNGSPINDLHRIDPVSNKDQVVDAAAMANADATGNLRSRRQARRFHTQQGHFRSRAGERPPDSNHALAATLRRIRISRRTEGS